MPTTWPLQSDLAAMHAVFGNPDANNDGAPDPAWVSKYLTTIIPPYAMFYGATRVKAITVNRGCAKELLAALGGILDHYKTENAIREVGLHNYSGCYNFRPKRGGSSLSMHAYGAAIDLDAAHNPFKSRKFTMPADAVKVFEDTGAVWGGRWNPPDGMHFQWARVR